MTARDPFQAPHVASRRGGPVKEPLSRDAIVSEALRQLGSGDGEMSLRKVASALETGAASLYAYVENLDELRALVLDRALGDVKLGAAKGSWRERLQKLLASYVRALSASPGLARLAFGTVAVGPNALRIVEALLALLAEGGVEPVTAAWAVDLLLLYVTSVAAEHAGGFDPAAPDGPVARALARAAEQDYPQLFAARPHLLSGTAEQRFTWAVDVLLHGIVQAPRRRSSARQSKAAQRKTRQRI